MTNLQSSNNKAVEAFFTGKHYKDGEVEVKISRIERIVFRYAGRILASMDQNNSELILYRKNSVCCPKEIQHTKDLAAVAEGYKVFSICTKNSI